MHKNQHSSDAVEEIRKIISAQTLSSVSFDDAVAKTYFFHKVASILQLPTVYLDFDVLYSGYVVSGMLQKSDDVELLQPTSEVISDMMVGVLEKISLQKHLVIIDSLNGLFTMLDQKDAGRLVNSMVMLLTSAGQKTSSYVLVGSISKFRQNEGWTLTALGRRVIEIERMNILSVKKTDSQFQISVLDHNNFQKSAVRFDLDQI